MVAHLAADRDLRGSPRGERVAGDRVPRTAFVSRLCGKVRYVVPGTPLRTAAYLVFYALVGALALGWSALANPSQWTFAVAGVVAAVSLAAGLPIRVTVESASWRRMCRARNVTLCAALLFSDVISARFS